MEKVIYNLHDLYCITFIIESDMFKFKQDLIERLISSYINKHMLKYPVSQDN